ncbi:MAG: pyruvate dehydrogenase complex E1 component subunit beta [candidate division WOR-3 bacterium]
MSMPNRRLQYSLAINEAFHQLMEADESVFLMGQGVKSPWYVGNTAKGLLERFGPRRVIDTPVSENGITGAAIGAAIAGMRPIVVHPRMDFLLYALDPIINEAANWRYMFGGASKVPVVIWAIVNRGGEQGAQHSQALQALFTHVPGLKVVMPSNPYDAKGLMISAVRDDNPVVYIDDRWLYCAEDDVPNFPYAVPIGKARVSRPGEDCTVIATSYMVSEALRAASILENEGVSIEVIDLRTNKPLDHETLSRSIRKTRKVIAVDAAWRTCGLAGEVVAWVSENLFDCLAAPPVRVTLPDVPAPASATLESVYYPTGESIAEAVRALVQIPAERSVSGGI